MTPNLTDVPIEDIYAGGELDNQDDGFDPATADFGDDFADAGPVDDAPQPEPESKPEVAPDSDEPAEAEGDAEDIPDEVEEAAEVEPEPEPAPKKKNHMIPKSRLEDEVAKRRKLETELEALRNREPEPAPKPEVDTAALDAEIDGLIEQANEALLDGNTKEASRLQREAIRKQSEADRLATRAPEPEKFDRESLKEEVRESLRVETVLESVKETYPELDRDSDNYDGELEQRAAQLEQMYFREGYTASQALRKGVEDAIKLQRPDLLEGPAPAPVAKAARDTSTNIRKNVKASNQQPPKARGGIPADDPAAGIDINSLAEEEYDALPESKLAELRGDFL